MTKSDGTILTGKKGGTRQALEQRWDLIPGGWQTLIEVARIADYGAKKHSAENWKRVDTDTEQSPLNHGLAHAYKSLEFDPGSDARIRQLAKAAWNILAQIWFEKQPHDIMSASLRRINESLDEEEEVEKALDEIEAELDAEAGRSDEEAEADLTPDSAKTSISSGMNIAEWFKRG